jgi:hypothetical protein
MSDDRDSSEDDDWSSIEEPSLPTDVVDIAEDLTGATRYITTARQFLGVQLTQAQRRIFRAVANNKRVYVQSGNGVGKSFTAAALNLAFLSRHPQSICLATSGTYSVLSDVLWKPMRRLYSGSELPGRALESPPRIQIDDEWYFKAVAPRHPSNLEGRHAETMLVTLEEVDKPDITREHFDSAESMLTGETDRILAIANPPKDESNVAAELRDSDRWHTVRFSSFDSHNVRVDAGTLDADRIPGLVGLETIREDWENWNGEPWPGLETARTAHEERTDLDQRWYRRRAGVTPPAASAAYRPFDVSDVEGAVERMPETAPPTPDAIGIDVARSGDRTVMAAVHGDDLRIHYSEQGTDHTTQESRLRTYLDGWLQGSETAPIAVDAVGEGSALADRLSQAYRKVDRFKAGSEARDATEYADCWAEALGLLGQFFGDNGALGDRELREECLAAARAVEYEERHLASRGTNGATVLRASSKEDIKQSLGRSPDHLDAAAMAVWARDADGGDLAPEDVVIF